LLAVFVVMAVEARENCCFRILAYEWLTAICMGLSSRCRSRDEGGSSTSGRMDFQIIASKFLSIQAHAAVKLDLVVTMIVLL